MSKADSARLHEQTARAEIIQRVGLRDNALVLYLGAVGALVSFAGTANKGTEILLIIPYLAFGATTIIEHHHMMIGVLSHYLAVDLDTQYRRLKEFVPQWDNSASAREVYAKRPYFIRRKFGHWILVAMPAVLSLIVNYQYIWQRSFLTAAWWLGSLLALLSIVTIAQSSAYR
jgi:hypothetical protein